MCPLKYWEGWIEYLSISIIQKLRYVHKCKYVISALHTYLHSMRDDLFNIQFDSLSPFNNFLSLQYLFKHSNFFTFPKIPLPYLQYLRELKYHKISPNYFQKYFNVPQKKSLFTKPFLHWFLVVSLEIKTIFSFWYIFQISLILIHV